MKEIKWNDRFNVGVDIIDSAHKKLFSIVGKLIALNEGENKQQHACWEGILCILCTDITVFFAPGLPPGSKGKACAGDRLICHCFSKAAAFCRLPAIFSDHAVTWTSIHSEHRASYLALIR